MCCTDCPSSSPWHPRARPDGFTLGEQRSPPPPPSPVPPPPALDGTLAAACSDACPHARDGECDDGGDGSLYMACAHGTDCMDCGERPHASPPPSTPASPSAASGLPASECTDSCFHSNDGECDDGGHGALYSACDHGSDCADCGHRFPSAPPPASPPPAATTSAPPSECTDSCFHARD
ncbi:hypothetical protein EMIHUDRAFT_260314, partial [Emiliania huxleyi CCMP1516]|uniref:Uncharacterized protein n=2 Tax=Emiliania huxleyi TaxID=2903 RepID=A0A0D3KWA9_EMIH1